MTPKIEVEALEVRAGAKRLLGQISMTLQPGGTLTVMGETGAGKSLLAQAILGTLPAGLTAQGRIALDGQRVDTLGMAERAAFWGRRIAMLPQEPWRALNPLLRSASQVWESHRLVAGRSPEEAARRTGEDFTAQGLTGAENRLPGALSGGMAQRVTFAAACAGGAEILLADEPTKGLDPERAARIAELLAAFVAESGTLLTITHDVELARRLGGAVMILKDGDLVEQGDAATVLTQPDSAYGRALIGSGPENWNTAPAPGGSEEVLGATGLALARGGRPLIQGLDLTLKAGERIAITGPSGTGKSSLLDALAGLLPPAAGELRRGAKVGKLGVQKLYQEPPAAFPPRIALGRSLRDVTQRHNIAWSRVETLLRQLKIAPALLERRPDAVSGGELQRIALARLLSLSPAVLLADEPTSRLDPVTQAETMEIIARAAAEAGTAVLLVTHDRAVANHWAGRQIDLADYRADYRAAA